MTADALPSELFGIPLTGWLGVLVVMVVAYVAGKGVDFLCSGFLRKLARKTKTTWDDQIIDALHSPILQGILIWGLVVSTGLLGMEEGVRTTTIHLLQTILLFVWTLFVWKAVAITLSSLSRHHERFPLVDERTLPLFDNLSRVLVFAGSLWVLIGIWEFNPSGWIASAGVVGLAVSFAAKDSLANLFSGVSIIADAPYQLGDYIVLDSGERGEVIQIGLRSTRLRTRDDIEIIIPNAVMGQTKITNETSGRHSKRRVRVRISAAQGADVDQVRQILLDSAANEPLAAKEPAPRVRFRRFGADGLEFELLCWVDEPVLRGRGLDALNTAVYKAFMKKGIEIPFPQRDVWMRTPPSS
ncbi:mechanosensitive ion channel family protein [bacterium]|nr:mechanosensitive ion channel family protein [bacterium]